jgi:FtsP/CotA-like multicopper oxidase with cupredoxin domain
VAGLFLLDDPDAPSGLPSDYGIDDIPVVLQDKGLGNDGDLEMSTPTGSAVGQLGDTILVNGTYNPHVEAHDELVRLRVLNASNGRVYNLGFDDDRRLDLVATDGGLLPEPYTTTRVQVSPGERVEILARFSPGERPVLRSYPPDLGLNFIQNRFSGGDDTFDVLEVRAADDLTPSEPPSDRIADDELPDPDNAVTTREFELNGSSRINGERMDPTRVDTVVAVGTTEIWEVTNGSGNPHKFHIHDVQFRVVDYDGDPPGPARWTQRHRLPPAGHHRPPRRELLRLHRPHHALHAPLPRPAPRGRRDDGPVHRRRTLRRRHRPETHQRPHAALARMTSAWADARTAGRRSARGRAQLARMTSAWADARTAGRRSARGRAQPGCGSASSAFGLDSAR